MPMVFSCVVCGKLISVNAAACPNCGEPVQAPRYRKRAVPEWVRLLFLLWGAAGLIFGLAFLIMGLCTNGDTLDDSGARSSALGLGLEWCLISIPGWVGFFGLR